MALARVGGQPVGVVKKHEGPVVVSGVEPAEQGSANATDVQDAGRAGSKASPSPVSLIGQTRHIMPLTGRVRELRELLLGAIPIDTDPGGYPNVSALVADARPYQY